MELPLKSYQTDAARAILTTLGYAREDWHSPRHRRTAFSLSSTTGSGKTVIAAAVIEALLRGSAEFDVDRDESAVFLWVSKDPSLNTQTRRRFLRYLPEIPSSDFIVLDETYGGSSLERGRVYFINPDKLRQGSRFVKHTDTRHYTFWEILKNTIETYRKLRNSIRWMLGTLHHFNRADVVTHADMPELERLMLHELAGRAAIVRRAYAEFDYKTVVASLASFMNGELSAFKTKGRKSCNCSSVPSTRISSNGKSISSGSGATIAEPALSMTSTLAPVCPRTSRSRSVLPASAEFGSTISRLRCALQGASS